MSRPIVNAETNAELNRFVDWMCSRGNSLSTALTYAAYLSPLLRLSPEARRERCGSYAMSTLNHVTTAVSRYNEWALTLGTPCLEGLDRLNTRENLSEARNVPNDVCRSAEVLVEKYITGRLMFTAEVLVGLTWKALHPLQGNVGWGLLHPGLPPNVISLRHLKEVTWRALYVWSTSEDGTPPTLNHALFASAKGSATPMTVTMLRGCAVRASRGLLNEEKAQ